MSHYNNQKNGYNRSRSYSGGDRYNNNRNNQGNEPFKKSGYEFRMVKNDGEKDPLPICWGWRKTRFGIQKMYAKPYKKTKIVTTQTGNQQINLFVILTSDAGIIKTSGMFNMTTKKLSILELGLVGSPNGQGRTASGKLSKGFFGKIR